MSREDCVTAEGMLLSSAPLLSLAVAARVSRVSREREAAL